MEVNGGPITIILPSPIWLAGGEYYIGLHLSVILTSKEGEGRSRGNFSWLYIGSV